jgi:hypothetical protein
MIVFLAGHILIVWDVQRLTRLQQLDPHPHPRRRLAVWTVTGLAVYGLAPAGLTWALETALPRSPGFTREYAAPADTPTKARAVYLRLHQGVLVDDQAMSSAETLEDLAARQAVCRRQVEEYNTLAAAAATAGWRPPGLPARLGDTFDTDCEPPPA